jgi:hypothetical protein
MIIETSTKTIVKEINISAREWLAYSSMEGVEIAAMKVNHALKEFVEAGLTKAEVLYNMQDVFDQYSMFGFADGDSNDILKFVLKKIYS